MSSIHSSETYYDNTPHQTYWLSSGYIWVAKGERAKPFVCSLTLRVKELSTCIAVSGDESLYCSCRHLRNVEKPYFSEVMAYVSAHAVNPADSVITIMEVRTCGDKDSQRIALPRQMWQRILDHSLKTRNQYETEMGATNMTIKDVRLDNLGE